MMISSSLIADISFKIIFVGDSHVGKTALISRFKSDSFDLHARPTVGVEFAKRIVRYKRSNQNVQIHLWDTAGQERYKAITKQHYRGADAALIIFDLDQPNSFDSIVNWVNEVKENSPPGCILGIIGNKADMNTQTTRAVSREAYCFARDSRILYFETSAYWSRTEGGLPSKPFAKGVESIVIDTIESNTRLMKENNRDIGIAVRNPKKSSILYDKDSIFENENVGGSSIYETLSSRYSMNNFGDTMARSICNTKVSSSSSYKEMPKVNLNIKSEKDVKSNKCDCQ